MKGEFENRIDAIYEYGDKVDRELLRVFREMIDEARKKFLKFKKEAEMVEPYEYVTESIKWFEEYFGGK